MSFYSLYLKYPRPASVLIMLVVPFAFIKAAVMEAPWGELREAYRELWATLKTGKPLA